MANPLPGFVPETAGPALAHQAEQSGRWLLWAAQGVNVVLFFGLAFGLGWLVTQRGWKVGYTRKILALALYAWPYVFSLWSPGVSAIEAATVSMLVFSACIAVMIEPIRTRVPFLATAFACIDRPEDRPFTIVWLLSAIAATYAVILVWLLYGGPSALPFLFVALFVSGVGDALAEPVGLRFGRHTYQTRALGTDRLYVRSFEGSAVVALSGVIGVLIAVPIAAGAVFWAAIVAFPVVATLAEAKSPHTWDQPFIIASCGLAAGVITALT